MRAAVEVRPCKRKGCPNSLPAHAAPQARYCGTESCDQERAAERKALQHAREANAYTRVVLELEERPKRRTSEDEGERGASTHRTPEHVLHRKGLKLEDKDSPGELWLRGEHQKAAALAKRRMLQALIEARTPGGDVGLWDGLGMSPARLSPGHEVWPCGKEKRDPPELSPNEQRCDALMRANRGLG